MARLPVVPASDAGWLVRLAYRYLARRFGALPEPLAVLARHRRLFFADAAHEAAVGAAANVLPTSLSNLAVYRAATRIGCSWCVDFGAMMHRLAGLDDAQLRHIDDYRTSPRFTANERAVIDYATAMTDTPPAVTDDQVVLLRRLLGDAGVIELTYLIALENLRSRMNSALGITAQGFATGRACTPRADITEAGQRDGHRPGTQEQSG